MHEKSLNGGAVIVMLHMQIRSNFIVSMNGDFSYKRARHFAVPGSFFYHFTGELPSCYYQPN